MSDSERDDKHRGSGAQADDGVQVQGDFSTAGAEMYLDGNYDRIVDQSSGLPPLCFPTSLDPEHYLFFFSPHRLFH